MSNLTIKNKLCYASGDLACNLTMQSVTYFLLFFYTDIYGISAFAASNILFTARVWDAINDPMMGIIADKTNTRWGRFRPYLIGGGAALSLFVVLVFTTPDLSYHWKIIYALVTYNLFNMAYTATNMPYSALSSTITKNPEERASLATWRMSFAFLGGLIVTSTIPVIANSFSTPQAAYQIISILFAVLGFLLLLITFLGTTESYVFNKENNKYKISQIIPTISKNKSFVILLGSYFFVSTTLGVRASSAMYYLKYNITLTSFDFFSFTFNFQSFYLMISLAFIVLGILLSPYLIRKFEKKSIYVFMSGLCALSCVIMYFLSPSINSLIIFTIISSIVTGPIVVLNWTMLPDTVDYTLYTTNKSMDGIFFAIFLFIFKASSAFGAIISGYILSYYNYVPNTQQTQSALAGIESIFFLIPAIFMTISSLCMLLYHLDKATIDRIHQGIIQTNPITK